MTPTIMIVDDQMINREVLKGILDESYILEEASDGQEAIQALLEDHKRISLMLLDIQMPRIDGFELLGYLKKNRMLQDISVIMITASDDPETESRALRMGALDFITKPFNADVVKARIETQLELKFSRDNLNSMLDQSLQQLDTLQSSITNTLASVIEYRNMESGTHVKRTQQLTALLLKRLLRKEPLRYRLTSHDADVIVKVSALHDVGKICISDSILLKPGRLTDEEFDEMKLHTIKGEEIVSQFFIDVDNEYIKYCKQICRHHHEKWDGTGYPDRLRGEKIPVSARVLAVVDVYDALVSERVYKAAYTHQQAIGIMEEQSGKHFDPRILEAFLELDEQLGEIYEV